MRDDDMWFEPKRFGYGAGLPIAWQGWALLIGYIAVVALLARFVQDRLWFGLAVGGLTLLILPIVAIHTRGGWRWRWGGSDD